MDPVLRTASKDARFQFIEAEQSRFGVKHLCERLGVSRSGFYAWRRRPVSKHHLEDEALLLRIRDVFIRSKGIAGSPVVHRRLRREGVRVGCKRVARLMRQNGLKARAATLYRRSPGTARFFRRHPNRIVDVKTSAPNQILVADITYVKFGRTQMYLAAILDRHTRRVLAWDLAYRRDVVLTLRVLERALQAQPAAPGAIFHSDRGTEYCAYPFSRRLADARILQSTNRPKEITDNAVMESFWHSLKTECYHGHKFLTEKALRAALAEFMHDYNHDRLHSALDYRTPIEYELEAA